MHDSINTAKTIKIAKPATVLDAFLQNINAAPVYLLAGLHGAAQVISRQEILGRGCALAHKFRFLGVEPGDKVLTILPTGKAFLVSVFGAWCAGAAIVPVAPPATGISGDLYEKKLSSMIRTAQPKVIIADDSAFAALKNLSELTANITF